MPDLIWRKHLRFGRNGKLLLVAGTLQLSLTFGMFLIGRSKLSPNQIDTNGIAVSFAPDAVIYNRLATSLANDLRYGAFESWLRGEPQLHVRIYSLAFTAFGLITGNNVLAAEPVNLFYYLLTIFLIFDLGREIFDSRVGLLAAGVVALWPSFLLHSTQLLRDPLSTIALLTMMLIVSKWMIRAYSWRTGLMMGAGAAAMVVTLWVVRIDMWFATRAFAVLGVCLVVAEQLIKRRARYGNLIGAMLLLVIALIIPFVHTRIAAAISNPAAPRKELPIMAQSLPLAYRLSKRRQAAVEMGAKSAASNLDTSIEFRDTSDVVKYFPRATEIGALAPFPNMWITTGTSVGRSGRVLAGAEMTLTYVLELAALLSILLFYRRLPVWFLFLVALIGIIGLGLVVVNMGTLYRLRYPFWIIFVILGAAGISRLTNLGPRMLRAIEPK